jgi:ATP-dependent Lon protease
MTTQQIDTENTTYPLLPLRDVVVYPHMVVPLFVGRERSIVALEQAMEAGKELVLITQKEPSEDDPKINDVYQIGTLANILQMFKLPDGTLKVLVEGTSRVRLVDAHEEGEFLQTKVELLTAAEPGRSEIEALSRSAMSLFEQYVNLSKKIPSEVIGTVSAIEGYEQLADTIASHMTLSLEQKQDVLEIVDLNARFDHLMVLMDAEIDLFQIEHRIRGRVKKQMEKGQREYYLNEKIKAIQKELGDDEGISELDQLDQKVNQAGMPKMVLEKAKSEIAKLKMMSPMSAEASVLRNYIDWMIGVPWKARSRVKHNLENAEKTLNDDHFGLQEVKERILEFLAVQKRVKKLKGPVLCLVGPPGVGKTSLGESIARATGRKFVRMSLGGVRDEAEIRGHRRTYIGSLPGKIIQKLSKVKTKNPLFLLDEIDKMGMDHRGDPASALLEVLDPEQNHTFNDHYLEVDYDLSEVMFICTANSMNIPGPLLDRMEIIRIPGYTEEEKIKIAEKYLLPKQRVANGLKDTELTVENTALRDVIRYYTREAGVRGLERSIAKICRKIVTRHVRKKSTSEDVVGTEALEDILGVKRYNYGRAEGKNNIGQATGLAWTEVGGELLTIESSVIPGRGNVIKTGSLGDVMQESIQAALTVVRSRSQQFGIRKGFYRETDIHIHVPEGAVPKDGPSAGIGMCTALVSALTRIAVKSTVAMTGEITLHGQVLKIGGLKEKLLAAHRGSIETVIIPHDNTSDLKDIPDNIKKDLQICPVKWIDEVLEIALVSPPTALSEEDYNQGSADKIANDDAVRPSTH